MNQLSVALLSISEFHFSYCQRSTMKDVRCISKEGSCRAYFDGFQIVAMSFIAEFSFRFCRFALT